MSKIRELESVIGSGARNNKYRVIFPYFGRELDIQTHDVTAPGRSMGVAEVYLKGRRYQLAGDRADEGSITLTFYNDPKMTIRKFFLQIISGIQNFNVPVTMDGGLSNDVDYSSFAGSIGQQALLAFDEMRANFRAVTGFLDSMGSDKFRAYNVNNQRSKMTLSSPWYQTDVIIQQLDHDNMVTTESIYHNAFVTDVSSIDYQDEVGDISTTTLTLAYTGVSYSEESADLLGQLF